jgi:hypothetical protein
MKRYRARNLETVDVSFIYENGDYHLFAGDGLAPCDLWADIAPSDIDDGTYVFVGIYLESQYTNDLNRLDGPRKEEASKILEANEDWCRWAADEVRSMTQYSEPEYDRLRAVDVVDCGRRI